MRPDRIILGEIRKENAFTFCSAINTGHAGSMGTIHANDPKSALDAVINRVMLNGDTTESAIAVLRRQLINDIYGVVQLDRTKQGIVGYFTQLKKEDADRRESPDSPAPEHIPHKEVG
jgi:Flp pilus assembly CpaF family ATPase